MHGGIYTNEKCKACGKTLKDNLRNALTCPEHPDQRAQTFRVHFKGVKKRFQDYKSAARFLVGLRFKTDEDTFDQREYQKGKPQSFDVLANRYLKLKAPDVKKGSFVSIRNHLYKAVDYFKDRNVKEIKKLDLQEYFLTLHKLASKSRYNHKSTLHSFFNWLEDLEDILKEYRAPKFPKFDFTMKRKKVIDKKTQLQIIQDIYETFKNENIRVYIAILFLSTYLNVRPGELIRIREKDIDYKKGEITLTDTKTNDEVKIFLLPEDLELIRSVPRGLPNLLFFRHAKPHGRAKAGDEFSNRYLNDQWKKAAAKFGVFDVSVYPGTRHSSIYGLREQGYTTSQLMDATGHRTSKSFQRYFNEDPQYMRNICSDIRGGKEMGKDFGSVQS